MFDLFTIFRYLWIIFIGAFVTICVLHCNFFSNFYFCVQRLRVIFVKLYRVLYKFIIIIIIIIIILCTPVSSTNKTYSYYLTGICIWKWR